jgi:hypothetical protein
MSIGLEVPPRPPWSPVPPALMPESRVEVPMVPVEPQWEYREIIRGGGTGLLSTGELDALGKEHWELAGVVAADDGVHFYFKRERRG